MPSNNYNLQINNSIDNGLIKNDIENGSCGFVKAA